MTKLAYNDYQNFLKECIGVGVELFKRAGTAAIPEWRQKEAEEEEAHQKRVEEYGQFPPIAQQRREVC